MQRRHRQLLPQLLSSTPKRALDRRRGATSATAAMHEESVVESREEDTQHVTASQTGGERPAERSARGRPSKARWLGLTLASGACAACNGVFAKLTTTSLTASIAARLAHVLGLASAGRVVKLAVRAVFFILNLTFNGIMWTLFTAALACASSTTQVSIINTFANFVLTALLGLLIFSEALPPLWWAGAVLLVAGNVIVGAKRKDEEKEGGGPDGVVRNESPDHRRNAGAASDPSEAWPLLREESFGGTASKDVAIGEENVPERRS